MKRVQTIGLHTHDYKGFGLHLEEAKAKGVLIDSKYLKYLADIYNTPIPNSPEWEKRI